MSRSTPLVDEVAIELATWPGVRIERGAEDTAVVLYESTSSACSYRERGEVELPFLGVEHDELIEHGDAEPGDVTPESTGVSHPVHGPSDITEVLELFDRRYRELRGDDEPYSSEDPD